jgi:hypothetical protein
MSSWERAQLSNELTNRKRCYLTEISQPSLASGRRGGTYWHNNFGRPMSHGCVCRTLPVAAWLYGWAPLGTGGWVHE